MASARFLTHDANGLAVFQDLDYPSDAPKSWIAGTGFPTELSSDLFRLSPRAAAFYYGEEYAKHNPEEQTRYREAVNGIGPVQRERSWRDLLSTGQQNTEAQATLHYRFVLESIAQHGQTEVDYRQGLLHPLVAKEAHQEAAQQLKQWEERYPGWSAGQLLERFEATKTAAQEQERHRGYQAIREYLDRTLTEQRGAPGGTTVEKLEQDRQAVHDLALTTSRMLKHDYTEITGLRLSNEPYSREVECGMRQAVTAWSHEHNHVLLERIGQTKQHSLATPSQEFSWRDLHSSEPHKHETAQKHSRSQGMEVSR